jgi:hypothetical protein
MTEIRYEDVAPLVAGEVTQGDGLQVTFKCPVTGGTAQGYGSFPTGGLFRRIGANSTTSLLSSARSRIAGLVRNATGTSLVGSIGGQAASEVVYGVGGPQRQRRHVSGKDRKTAIVAAFGTVTDQFTWDANGRRYLWSTAAQAEASLLEQHVRDYPISVPYDRQVFARMITAVIAADGSVADEERATFNEILPWADLDALMAAPRPGAADLAETQLTPSRETMLMLCWSVALCDGQLDPAEHTILSGFASGLGIDSARELALIDAARTQVIEASIATLAGQGQTVDQIRPQIEMAAPALGADPQDAARVLIRWAKRTNRI